ncbi:hypothetical protein [Parapedobacter lycopersici]|uniref:hypothetical protein n=1 Tax=Parapedobacter lycopersici TaxID=1864939 RepID=UPI003341C1C7
MNNSRKSLIVFSAFALTYFGEIAINIACGPEPDPYDYYVSYFHNNTPGDAYVPFSFTGLRFLYDENEPESESLINSREWARYLGKQVTAADVGAIMYRTDAATDSLIAGYLTGSPLSLPDSLQHNTYLLAMVRHKAAREYYLFAKESEPYAVVSYQNYWDPDPRDTMDAGEMEALADRAETHAAALKRDRFLRLRYAYQAARMYHYAGAYERCVEIYDQYIATAPGNSAVKGWALSLKAGAVRRLGNPATAAYLFSRVFTLSPERRVQAYKNFHYIDVTSDEVLAQAESDDERAAIAAIEAFTNADFDVHALASVYSLAPRSPLVGVLLTREINKLETQLTETSAYYNGGWWSGYREPDSVITRARQHAVRVAEFAQQLAVEKQYTDPDLGTIAAAYINWLLGETEKATATLATVKLNRLSERLADQYRIIELLVQVRTLEVSNALDEQAMLPALQWLEQKRQRELAGAREQYGTSYDWLGASELRFNRTATNLYQSVLAPHFMRQRDTAMAALFMWNSDFPLATDHTADTADLYNHMSWSAQSFWQEQLQPAALEQLAKWGREGLEQPWAALFEGRLGGLDSDDYWDLLGTAYLRMHDYPAASRAFDHLSSDFEQEPPVNWYSAEEDTLWPDPFVTTIKDYPKKFGNTSLSKADFAKAMAGLQLRIEQDPVNAAGYYYQLANGVYQTGAFGNSWQLISYTWTSADNYVKGDYYYAGDFHEARQAAVWYAKARELSDDREFQAKCTFMLAKCEQKLYQFDSISDYYENGYVFSQHQPDPYWLFSQRNRYFGELRDKYQDTEFARAAIAECTYLADFVMSDLP